MPPIVRTYVDELVGKDKLTSNHPGTGRTCA
jgi:hypothetical protein